MQVQKWLKYYVMIPSINQNKPMPQLQPMIATFFASSVWHGTYPGFYILFIAGILNDILTRGLGKTKIAHSVCKWLPEWAQYLVCFLWQITMTSFFFMATHLLRIDKFITLCENFYYAIPIVFSTGFVLSIILPKVPRVRKQKNE